MYVEDWRLVQERGQKVNKYTLYIKKDNKQPVYYEMHGYDSLLGSHFDDYKITYDSYTTEYEDSIFDAPIKGTYIFYKKPSSRPIAKSFLMFGHILVLKVS